MLILAAAEMLANKFVKTERRNKSRDAGISFTLLERERKYYYLQEINCEEYSRLSWGISFTYTATHDEELQDEEGRVGWCQDKLMHWINRWLMHINKHSLTERL